MASARILPKDPIKEIARAQAQGRAIVQQREFTAQRQEELGQIQAEREAAIVAASNAATEIARQRYNISYQGQELNRQRDQILRSNVPRENKEAALRVIKQKQEALNREAASVTAREKKLQQAITQTEERYKTFSERYLSPEAKTQVSEQIETEKRFVAQRRGEARERLEPRARAASVAIHGEPKEAVAPAGWYYEKGKIRQPLTEQRIELMALPTGKPQDITERGAPMEIGGVPVEVKPPPLKAKDVLESYLEKQQELAALGIKDFEFKGAEYTPSPTEYAQPVYTERERKRKAKAGEEITMEDGSIMVAKGGEPIVETYSTLSGWVVKSMGGVKGVKFQEYTLPSGIKGTIPIPTGEKLGWEKAPKVDIEEKLMWQGYTKEQIERGKELVGVDGGWRETVSKGVELGRTGLGVGLGIEAVISGKSPVEVQTERRIQLGTEMATKIEELQTKDVKPYSPVAIKESILFASPKALEAGVSTGLVVLGMSAAGTVSAKAGDVLFKGTAAYQVKQTLEAPTAESVKGLVAVGGLWGVGKVGGKIYQGAQRFRTPEVEAMTSLQRVQRRTLPSGKQIDVYEAGTGYQIKNLPYKRTARGHLGTDLILKAEEAGMADILAIHKGRTQQRVGKDLIITSSEAKSITRAVGKAKLVRDIDGKLVPEITREPYVDYQVLGTVTKPTKVTATRYQKSLWGKQTPVKTVDTGAGKIISLSRKVKDFIEPEGVYQAGETMFFGKFEKGGRVKGRGTTMIEPPREPYKPKIKIETPKEEPFGLLDVPKRRAPSPEQELMQFDLTQVVPKKVKITPEQELLKFDLTQFKKVTKKKDTIIRVERPADIFGFDITEVQKTFGIKTKKGEVGMGTGLILEKPEILEVIKVPEPKPSAKQDLIGVREKADVAINKQLAKIAQQQKGIGLKFKQPTRNIEVSLFQLGLSERQRQKTSDLKLFDKQIVTKQPATITKNILTYDTEQILGQEQRQRQQTKLRRDFKLETKTDLGIPSIVTPVPDIPIIPTPIVPVGAGGLVTRVKKKKRKQKDFPRKYTPSLAAAAFKIKYEDIGEKEPKGKKRKKLEKKVFTGFEFRPLVKPQKVKLPGRNPFKVNKKRVKNLLGI